MKRTNTAKWVESVGRWQINVQQNGERKTFTSAKPGRTGQREANAKADAWLEDGIKSQKIKVREAWVEFYERVKKTTSRSNYEPMDGRWRIWIKPRIGEKKLQSLTTQNVQDILDDAHAKGRSRKTISNIMGDLNNFFRFCRRAGYSTFFPEDLRIPEGARLKERQILQPKDFAILMNSSKTIYHNKEVDDPLIHYYRLAVLTGMRPGELLGLEWDDIKGDTVHIQRAINCWDEITRGKNDNAIRSVTLSEMAYLELQAQKRENPKEKRVFGEFNERYILKRWHIYAAYNHITPCTLYELRHTFVSIAANLPEGQMKRLVGHSKSMDTYGVYAHNFGNRGKEDASKLNEIFSELK